jgi:hypothetical protein
MDSPRNIWTADERSGRLSRMTMNTVNRGGFEAVLKFVLIIDAAPYFVRLNLVDFWIHRAATIS